MAQRHRSQTIISAYSATSVVDTPMRKVEVLEQEDGAVWLRETSFDNFRQAHVNLIHLEPHEAQSMARVLLDLDEAERPVDPFTHRPSIVDQGRNGNGTAEENRNV